jgi:hypothetical protein
MADITPVTKSDLLKSVGKSLTAQAAVTEALKGVSAEIAASRGQAAPPEPEK